MYRAFPLMLPGFSDETGLGSREKGRAARLRISRHDLVCDAAIARRRGKSHFRAGQFGPGVGPESLNEMELRRILNTSGPTDGWSAAEATSSCSLHGGGRAWSV